MTQESEMVQLARDVVAGQARSYVSAAKILAEYLLAMPNVITHPSDYGDSRMVLVCGTCHEIKERPTCRC